MVWNGHGVYWNMVTRTNFCRIAHLHSDVRVLGILPMNCGATLSLVNVKNTKLAISLHGQQWCRFTCAKRLIPSNWHVTPRWFNTFCFNQLLLFGCDVCYAVEHIVSIISLSALSLLADWPIPTKRQCKPGVTPGFLTAVLKQMTNWAEGQKH